MKKTQIASILFLIAGLATPAQADFGEADFPSELFDQGARSYHDAWCGRINNKCRVRFQGKAMWVEGAGGIQRSQLVKFRYRDDGNEFYNYITYWPNSGKNSRQKEALFLFNNQGAQHEFMQALTTWYRQDPSPNPNYRYPASQGPQETHGRDKSFGRNNNPYDMEPITDWSETTQPW